MRFRPMADARNGDVLRLVPDTPRALNESGTARE